MLNWHLLSYVICTSTWWPMLTGEGFQETGDKRVSVKYMKNKGAREGEVF